MKIAVTGGTGFVGSPLIRALVDAGHSVRLLARRRPPSAPTLDYAAFDAVQGLAPGALHGCDAVIHLAGESISKRWTPEHKQRILDSRVQGTTAIVQAAQEAKVRTLISTSAIGYYGERGSETLTEKSSPGQGFLADVCQAWEKPLAGASDAGIRTVVIRVGVVLHPSGGALQRMALPMKMGVGGKLGSGDQWMSWIHREDLIRLYLHPLAQEGVEGVLNGTAPHPVTNRELTHSLARALHRPAVFPVPAFALKTLLGEMSEVALVSTRVLPERTQASGFRFNHPTIDQAFADLYGSDSRSTRGATSANAGASLKT